MIKNLFLVCICLSAVFGVIAEEPRSLEQSREAVSGWMRNHRSLSRHEIVTAEHFAPDGRGEALHLFTLRPAGYVIANARPELPLILAFSNTSPLSLTESGANTLRAFLLLYLDSIPERLAAAQPRPMSEPVPQEDVYVAPMLDTAWNQTNPYNLLMPAADAGGGYDGRAPVGCVSVAYSQILNHHRWPVRGRGGHTYTDNSGLVTDTHSVTFDTAYDWDNMLPGYSAFGANPPEAAAAVSKLMWDLVVAKEANIEADGTSAQTLFLGQQLARHHYMEPPAKYAAGAEAELQAELQAGYPAIVEIPGHAVVADGLDISGATILYHIQYGWGGTNDGWFAASAIPGGGLTDVVTGIRPSLMPFAHGGPVSAPVNQSATLAWVLPRHRSDEISALRLHQQQSSNGTWTAEADALAHVEAQDWSLVTDPTRGPVWFAGPNGPATLLLSERFTPTATSTLSFWMQYRLSTATLHVQISNDGGLSFTTIGSYNNNYPLSWTQRSLPLAAYAGQTVWLRFYLSSGSFYPDTGGVWLDSFSVSNTAWTQWNFWKQINSFTVESFSAVSTLLDEADDFTVFEKTSTSTYKDWQIASMNDGNGFYKEPDGYSNRQYHLTSVGTVTPTDNTRLVLYGRYKFATDFLRVLASPDRSAWTEIARFTGNSPRTEIKVGLGAYAGQAIHLRFEYVVGSFYSDGGVWIDHVSLEELTNPELEGQPLHYTQVGGFELDGLAEGTHILAATAVDRTSTEHRLSPAFTLTLTEPETSRGTLHSWLVTHGDLAPAADDATFEAADLDDSADPGFALWKHFLAGTLPGSPLAATPSFSDSTVTVSWNGQPGRSYRVLRTNDLSQPIAQWTPQGETITATELNQPLSFDDQPPPPGPWFYALELVTE